MKLFRSFLAFPNLALKLTMAATLPWSADKDKPSVDSPKGKLLNYLGRLWFATGMTNLVYQNVGMVIHLIMMRDRLEGIETIREISETGSIMGLTLIGSMKACILYRYRKTITQLIREFEVLFEGQGFLAALGGLRVDFYLQRSRYLMKHTTVFFLAAYTFYNTLPIVVLVFQAVSGNHQISYSYQSNTWYPWTNAALRRLSFVCSFLCQMQSSLTGVAFIMAGEFLLCFFITQLQMHLDFVARALGQLDAHQPDAGGKLQYIIRYHKYLLSLSERINGLFNLAFVMNFVTATIAICLMGFSMLMISAAHACKFSVGLLSFLIFTLFICYNGEEFATAHEDVLTAAFHGNWYEGDRKYRKMFLFFMTNAKKPRQLKVYNFTAVSMRTYMAILNISYKMFTFFKAMA